MIRPGCTYLAGAPILVAHRGGSKLAPENTLTAFQRAIDWWGADMLELDVRLTKDGVVVVFHDETVDRTTDGSGRVADFTLAELKELDAGYRFTSAEGEYPFRGKGVVVPTLAEVLEAFPGMRINAESKEPQVALPLLEVILEHAAAERTLFAAGYERFREGVTEYPGPWGASRHHVLTFWVTHRLPGFGPYTPAADVLQVPETWKGRRIVTPRFVRAAHARNLPVQVWTVDAPDDMRRLLSWGVDGIQSDRPDLLAQVLTEVTGRKPAPGPAGVTA